MSIEISFRANKESIKKMADQSFAVEETRFLQGTLRPSDIADYLEKRAEVEFFQDIYALIKDVDDSLVEDHLAYATKPSSARSPFSRSTSAMGNLMSDYLDYLKASVYNKIMRNREVRAEVEFEKRQLDIEKAAKAETN